MNRRERQEVRQIGRRSTGVDPRQFEGHEGQGQVLGSFDEPAVLGVYEHTTVASFWADPQVGPYRVRTGG